MLVIDHRHYGDLRSALKSTPRQQIILVYDESKVSHSDIFLATACIRQYQPPTVKLYLRFVNPTRKSWETFEQTVLKQHKFRSIYISIHPLGEHHPFLSKQEHKQLVESRLEESIDVINRAKFHVSEPLTLDFHVDSFDWVIECLINLHHVKLYECVILVGNIQTITEAGYTILFEQLERLRTKFLSIHDGRVDELVKHTEQSIYLRRTRVFNGRNVAHTVNNPHAKRRAELFNLLIAKEIPRATAPIDCLPIELFRVMKTFMY